MRPLKVDVNPPPFGVDEAGGVASHARHAEDAGWKKRRQNDG